MRTGSNTGFPPCSYGWECSSGTSNHMFSGSELYGFIAGASVGLVIGLILGLKNRRDILNASDDLLSQIEDLKKN